ncbi:hypothetical protein EV646_111334 [Kribbella antiqua]|uniref:Uncharacterized protein n=1 Tax=Kribbella antiqua TaxID=2512217 RepID=A0A4V2S3G0_9ACTN|nr:hypothetical protein EV646_111334 [Kribbella antiqua]
MMQTHQANHSGRSRTEWRGILIGPAAYFTLPEEAVKVLQALGLRAL